MIKIGPLNVGTVRGEPYYVGGRKLIPVVRMLSWGNARATIGTHQTGGWAGGFAWIRPVAVWEETPAGERRIPITDPTAAILRRQLAMAAVVLCFFVAFRQVVSRLRTAKRLRSSAASPQLAGCDSWSPEKGVEHERVT